MKSPVTHIVPLTEFRRVRLLKHYGQVLVRIGQKIEADEVVAEARIARRFDVVSLRRTLGIKGRNEIKQVLKRNMGDEVQEGDLIAEKGGLFKKSLRAVDDCTLKALSGLNLLLEIHGGIEKLRAGFSGKVVDIISNQGVIIEARGALLQGVWGNGKLNAGLLVNRAKDLESELTETDLDVTLRGSIVFAAHISRPEVMRLANETGLKGLIVGSMTSNLIRDAKEAKFPVIVLDGFGKFQMYEKSYQILVQNEGRTVSINAIDRDDFSGDKPEVFIELPVESSQTALETGQIQPGENVRINMPPYLGKSGLIRDLPKQPVLLPNNLRAKCAVVRLESGKEITIPVANLDLIK